MSKYDLKTALAKFQEKHVFKVGDVVEWKPQMKHKKAEGPFIVVEVLDEPVFDPELSAGSTYFREPLDIILGFIDRDGDFVLYHYDSRRFQPAD